MKSYSEMTTFFASEHSSDFEKGTGRACGLVMAISEVYGVSEYRVITDVKAKIARIVSKCHYQGRYSATLTRPQLDALFHLYKRAKASDESLTYRAFRKSVQWEFGSRFSTIIVPFRNMIVGIEPDGYRHS